MGFKGIPQVPPIILSIEVSVRLGGLGAIPQPPLIVLFLFFDRVSLLCLLLERVFLLFLLLDLVLCLVCLKYLDAI
jgi:hypothetical protein